MNDAGQKSMYEETGEPVMLAMATSSYSRSSRGEWERGGERERGLRRRTREFSGIMQRERGGGTGRGWEEDEDEDDEGREIGRPRGQRR